MSGLSYKIPVNGRYSCHLSKVANVSRWQMGFLPYFCLNASIRRVRPLWGQPFRWTSRTGVDRPNRLAAKCIWPPQCPELHFLPNRKYAFNRFLRVALVHGPPALPMYSTIAPSTHLFFRQSTSTFGFLPLEHPPVPSGRSSGGRYPAAKQDKCPVCLVFRGNSMPGVRKPQCRQ